MPVSNEDILAALNNTNGETASMRQMWHKASMGAEAVGGADHAIVSRASSSTWRRASDLAHDDTRARAHPPAMGGQP